MIHDRHVGTPARARSRVRPTILRVGEVPPFEPRTVELFHDPKTGGTFWREFLRELGIAAVRSNGHLGWRDAPEAAAGFSVGTVAPPLQLYETLWIHQAARSMPFYGERRSFEACLAMWTRRAPMPHAGRVGVLYPHADDSTPEQWATWEAGTGGLWSHGMRHYYLDDSDAWVMAWLVNRTQFSQLGPPRNQRPRDWADAVTWTDDLVDWVREADGPLVEALDLGPIALGADGRPVPWSWLVRRGRP